MSLQVRNQTSGILERVAGFNDTDSILSPVSQNPISNKAVYNALLQKIDKTVTDLVNYYDKSQVYSKPEVRALIGAINTLTIKVVSALPTQDISTTTIYFVGPAAGTNNYDEYVYVGGNWVQIGDTTIDLSSYVTSTQLTTVLQDYYTQSQTDALFADYYDKDATDDLLDAKQDVLDFDNEPIAGSQNPVTSAGIKTALDNILISGNGGSIIKVHHLAGSAAQGDTVTASKGSYSVSSTFDASGDAMIIGFGEIGDITITATNGSETGIKIINIPCFSSYEISVGYTLDYKVWLIAGGLNPIYYPSLNDVLADEEAVRRLMTKHDSVDYLASLGSSGDTTATTILNNDVCAKWINLRDYALDTLYANPNLAEIMDAADKYFYGEWALNPQIPQMSSNTAPFGTVTASTDYSSSWGYRWKAFDGTYSDGQDRWVSSASDTNRWIQYAFPSAIRINAMDWRVGTTGEVGSNNRGVTTTGTISGSNDNSTWKVLATIDIDANKFIEMCSVKFDNDTAYTYYRISIADGTMIDTSNNRKYGQFAYIQLYSWGPKGNVPEMKTNAIPYGAASCSSYWQSNDLFNAWRAFGYLNLRNNADGRGWLGGQNTTNAWVQYKFENPTRVTRWDMTSFYGASGSTYTFTLSGSNDNSTFTPLATQTASPDRYTTVHTAKIANPDYYLYYRVTVSGVVVYDNQGTRHQFYGREMKVSVPIMTSDTAPDGEVIYSSVMNESYPAWKAFDKDTSTWWNSSTSDAEVYIGYDFKRPVLVNAVTYNLYPGASGTNQNFAFKIQGSNDKNIWTKLYEGSDIPESATLTKYLDLSDNHIKYRYYRMLIESDMYTNTHAKSIGELNFFGLDYFEYDWDANNPRHYIYDHGVELEPISSQVTAGNQDCYAEKNLNQLFLYKYGASNGCMFYATSQIDLTPYSIIRTVTGNKGYTTTSSNDLYNMVLQTTVTLTNTVYDALNSVEYIDCPNKGTILPISAFATTKYVVLMNWTGGSYTKYGTITEWWLE